MLLILSSFLLDVETQYYRQTSDARIPIKWTAPEAILEAKYTMASDVWSFGVLAWEVTSFAMMPYGNLNGADLIADLRQGYRLPHPIACPDPLYALAMLCWAWEPLARPSFKELVAGLNTVRAGMQLPGGLQETPVL